MGKLIRCITSDGCVTAMVLDSTDIVNTAAEYHQTSAVVTAAMGRLLTAASMMGNMLKGERDRLTLRIVGDGPVESIVAAADATGNVRGYVGNPVVEIPLKPSGKLDVSGCIGEGSLYVLKDLGMKEPYSGVIPLVSGEIAEDITSYYATSEQIPTVCALGVLVNPDLSVKVAGGLIIQLLPAADDEIIGMVERSIEHMRPMTAMLDEGMTPEQIAVAALGEFEVEVLYEQAVEYRCDCSRERTEKVLKSLGAEELQRLADEQPTTEVKCHFCNKEYKFEAAELRKIAQK